MRLIKTIILKTTTDCNLRCRYCYEFDRNGDTYIGKRIKADQLVSIIKRTARLFPDSSILWMFHGGEPLLSGVDCFRQVADCIRRVNKEYGVEYTLALQTNATLLTDAWIQVLEDNEDLLSERMVSISIDGPQVINDKVRVTSLGKTSYQKVIDAIERIRKSSVTFSTISVVGTHNVDEPETVYRFIRDLGSHFNKFIPCYNFDNAGQPERYGISPVQYAHFMCKVFDLWMYDLPHKDPDWLFIIDPIASLVSVISGVAVPWCEYRDEKCDNFTAIYPDGGLWLCDSFERNNGSMLNAFYLGNLFELSDEGLAQALLHPCQLCSYEDFYQQNTADCAGCSIQKICHSGCISKRAALRIRSASLAKDYCKGKHILIEHIKRGVTLALSQS